MFKLRFDRYISVSTYSMFGVQSKFVNKFTSFTANESSLISLLLISTFLIKSSSVSGGKKGLNTKKTNRRMHHVNIEKLYYS